MTLAWVGGASMRDLFVADGDLMAFGDNPIRCRTHMDVRLESDAPASLSQPVGNHHVLVPGHWAARLRESHDLSVSPLCQRS